ncbi:MAG TPA: hypothetical protein VNO34_09425 [Actinomycetota bacterium]|nr:hypothetical protein [Actinomycetota bacterium]
MTGPRRHRATGRGPDPSPPPEGRGGPSSREEPAPAGALPEAEGGRLPPPLVPARLPSWGLLAVAVLLAVVLALAVAGALGRGAGRLEGLASPTGGPSPSPSQPGGPPSPPPPPGRTASFPSEVRVGPLSLRVFPVLRPHPPCTAHTLDRVPAYLGDCPGRPGLFLFRVAVQNERPRRLPFRLANFVLVDRAGDLHVPAPARGRFGGERFLPRFALVPPGEALAGWVAFASGPGFVPDRLTYPVGGELAVVAFEGEHGVLPRPEP